MNKYNTSLTNILQQFSVEMLQKSWLETQLSSSVLARYMQGSVLQLQYHRKQEGKKPHDLQHPLCPRHTQIKINSFHVI